MSRKLLTLDDLYNFYSSKGKSTHFNAKNDDDRIIVGIPGKVNFEEKDDSKEGLCSVTLQACHISENLNKSFISEEAMTVALPSFSNRPILGYIYQDNNGNYQFRDHTMHLDEDGELIYDEVPVGIIPESCNARLEYDEDKEKTYVVVNGYIFEEYSKAKDILDRDNECNVSVELCIRECSYNAKDKLLNIEDFFFQGVTILGKWEDGSSVLPGMAGSNIRISDFKQRNNSVFSQNNMIAMLNEINDKLDQLSINIQGKEEQPMEDLENVEVTKTTETETEEVLTEEIEETKTETSDGEVTVTEAQSDDAADVTPSEDEKFTKTFELSHSDIKSALYVLLQPYEAEDNEWYWIDNVYDDHFIYSGLSNPNHIYDQKYTRDGDNVSFNGERIHMNVEYLTDSELIALNEIRSNYAKFEEIQDKLQKYEAEPEKMAILESSDYALIANSEEFIALKAQETHFDMTVEEVKNKANEILLNAAMKGTFAQAKPDKPKINMIPLPFSKPSARGRYGGLGKKKED